jgi:hypothetical protein
MSGRRFAFYRRLIGCSMPRVFIASVLLLALASLARGDEPKRAPAAKPHWAYEPLVRRAVPQCSDPAFSQWARNPVDAFVLAKLWENRLAPSPQAEPRALLRRIYFDLIGLPPTPEEMDEFLKQFAARPQAAVERVADRLLASPHYGEHWARHWLDVAHFAESHGHDQDRPRPNAWPYRDYVIRSFNDDKPYGRFVREQIAGDVLYPDDPWAATALGFLSAGPWDESSLMCIVDDTMDKKNAQVLDRDDMLVTAMTTFASSTVQCARCHDHKFDPISQADYYSLQADFAGVDRAERPYDPDPNVHARRHGLLARKKLLESDVAANELRSAETERRVAEWEKQFRNHANVWTTLEPSSFASANGTKAEVQPDGSLLCIGAAPEKDTYFITARIQSAPITAVRLEVMTDPSLPKQGPGRQDNGNLHLSEFRAFLLPDQPGLPPIPLKIKRASADFNQDGWRIEHALDGKKETAWGIYPEVGKSHAAVFELEQPLPASRGTTLLFSLAQLHGGRHLIGRPRLSATSSANPGNIRPQPSEIAAILAIEPAKRTDGQRTQLARHFLLQRVEEDLAALPPPKMVYAVASEFKPSNNFKPALKPRPVNVLQRGDIQKPLQSAEPGTLRFIGELDGRFHLSNPDDEGNRRAALADWLSDPKNVLVWRSIVNRIWHYHFGRGIVDTPNDFGKMGSPPSHPELLDWLAMEFRDSGGSFKRLHKLIVMSATYQQSSSIADCQLPSADSHNGHRQSAMDDRQLKDADNRLLWRMNSRRLEAECIRDTILQINARLDRTMGGPSVKQFIQTPGIHVTPNVDYAHFSVDDPANYRRCIYRFIFRTLPDPFLEAMDCPDASQQAAVRSSSITALQALSLLNNPFIARQYERLAARLEKEEKTCSGRVRLLYSLALGREARDPEITMLVQHAERFGLASACRVVLNSNEFLFVP